MCLRVPARSITDPTEHWTDLLGLTDYDVFPEEYADIYYHLEKQVFSGILIDDTILKMKGLREIGVYISMDDFGTGHSSLSMLRKLPLDQLKIDQSFVRDILSDPDDTVIVKTIIAMANNLGIEVIAEGVETETQRVFLEQNDCSLFQGFLFGKPVPVEEFEQLLKQ